MTTPILGVPPERLTRQSENGEQTNPEGIASFSPGLLTIASYPGYVVKSTNTTLKELHPLAV
jgi:hypothetical protein